MRAFIAAIAALRRQGTERKVVEDGHWMALAAATRAPTASHWMFWKNASMYFAAAAPKSN